MSEIKLIVGLGNPGSKYDKTRHNLGFMVVDGIAEKYNVTWKNWGDSSRTAQLSGERRTVLLKPQDFMNNSGTAVQGFMSYSKINPEELLVIVDDFSLPLGKLRLRLEGSAGGHNGLSSIIEHTKTQNFSRLRLGIGPLPENIDPADFVLSKFHGTENDLVKTMINRSMEVIDVIFSEGLDKAVSVAAQLTL